MYNDRKHNKFNPVLLKENEIQTIAKVLEHVYNQKDEPDNELFKWIAHEEINKLKEFFVHRSEVLAGNVVEKPKNDILTEEVTSKEDLPEGVREVVDQMLEEING